MPQFPYISEDIHNSYIIKGGLGGKILGKETAQIMLCARMNVPMNSTLTYNYNSTNKNHKKIKKINGRLEILNHLTKVIQVTNHRARVTLLDSQSCSTMSGYLAVISRLVNFFLKVPRVIITASSVCCHYSALLWGHDSSHPQCINEWAWLHAKKTYFLMNVEI